MNLRRWTFAILFIALAMPSRVFPQTGTIVSQIGNLNHSISGAIGAPTPNPAVAADLATQRQTLIAQLIKENPAAVKNAALNPEQAQWIRSNITAGAGLLEQNGEWTGSLEVIAEMDYANHKAWTHRYLRTASGRLELFGGSNMFHGIDSRGGATVRVSGISAAGVVAADKISVVAASTATSTGIALSPLGTENYAVMILTDSANPSLPAGWTTSAIQNLFFGSTGKTLQTFWQQASYGQTSAAGAVYGPFVLPQNYSCSAPDTSDSETLLTNAIAAAAGTVNFANVNRIALVFPDNNCNYGGLASVGGSSYPDLPNVTSVAWFPVESFQTTASYVGVIAHEAGHNLGLNHANSEDYGAIALGPPASDGTNKEYGDPFSAMDAGDTLGSSDSAPSEYSAQHKVEILNWIGANGYQEIATSGTYSLLPLETTAGTRGLRVLRDPVTQSWVWLESRQAIGSDDSSLNTDGRSNVLSGLLVHYENPDLDPLHTYLLDMNPAKAPNNFQTGALASGETWNDPYSLLSLEANAVGVSGSTVTVGYAAACASLASTGTVIPLAGGSGTVTVTAPSGCSWTASTGNSWLTLSTTSGQGSGTVGFMAAANSTDQQLNGVVTVGRQSVPVIQETVGVTAVNWPATTGRGASGVFTVEFADTNGSSDLPYIDVVLGQSADSWGLGNCYIEADTAGYFWLGNDDATEFLGPIVLNSGGTLSNSSCTLRAAGSSLVMTGTTAKLSVSVKFSSSINAQLGLYGFANSKILGWSYPYTFGNWFASSLAQTSTGIAATPNPALSGQSVIFSSTVSPATATGTVTFHDGTTVLGTGTIAGGTALFTGASLSAGVHSIAASYSGDAVNAPSSSMTLTETVTAPVSMNSSTVTLTSSANPSAAGTTLVLTAAVKPSTATGTIAFMDGTTALGTATLASGSAGLSISSLSAGAHSLTAVYGGDSADKSATSAVLLQTVSAAASPLPVISGVSSAASPSGAIASGTWISIYGNNLSTATGLVNLTGTSLITNNAGTSVTVNGKLAYLDYVSSIQLNVLTPVDAATGTVAIQVTTPGGASNLFTINKSALAPVLFPFGPQGGKYVAAEDAVTYQLIGPTGLLSAGYPTQPATAGEILTIFASGLGETTPAYPDGQIISTSLSVSPLPNVTVGGVAAKVQAAALISPGFYQINFTVPQLPSGDAQIGIQIGPSPSPSGLFLTIQ